MPNNSPSALLSAIKTTLIANPSLVPDTLRAIHLGANADQSSGFPFARIYLTDFTSEVTDNISTTRRYSFAVEIFQEYTQKSKENAELDLCTAVHGVLNRLEGTWQLGADVEMSVVQESQVQTVEIGGAPCRMARIRLTASTLVQNPA